MHTAADPSYISSPATMPFNSAPEPRVVEIRREDTETVKSAPKPIKSGISSRPRASGPFATSVEELTAEKVIELLGSRLNYDSIERRAVLGKRSVTRYNAVRPATWTEWSVAKDLANCLALDHSCYRRYRRQYGRYGYYGQACPIRGLATKIYELLPQIRIIVGLQQL